MIINLRKMINYINDKMNIDFELSSEETLNELKSEIIVKSKKIM